MVAMTVVAALSAAFTSCSKDDDGDGAPGKTEITLNGTTFDTRYAYYYIDDESAAGEGMHSCVLYFWNYDMLGAWQSQDLSKLPDLLSWVGIDFEVPVSQTDVRSVTLAPGDYHVYVVRDMPVSGGTNGWQGENDEFQPLHDTPLVIKKDGAKYTVSFSATIFGHNGTIQDLKFSYSGPLTLAPAHLFD